MNGVMLGTVERAGATGLIAGITKNDATGLTIVFSGQTPGANTIPYSIILYAPTINYRFYVDRDATAGANNGTSWDDAFTDLQTALLVADAGDEIWVAEGVYTPTAGTDRTVSFNLKTGVGVYGGFDGTEGARDERDWTTHMTTLSGDIGAQGEMSDNSYHVVYANSVTDATLDGVTITAGNANGPVTGNANGWDYSKRMGGGMYNYSSSPTLSAVSFSGNSAVTGGGMYSYSSSPTLTNVTFNGNSAQSGGGGGMFNNVSSPTLTNVTFSGSSAVVGGGMYNYSSSPTLSAVTFSGSSAVVGGGMYNYSSSPTLSAVTFSGNSAQSGGGMYNSGSSPTVTSVTFSGNSAQSGGGMHNHSSSPTLTNVTFSGNSADYGGGMVNNVSSPTLTTVTFSGNSADYGGGMRNCSSSPTLTNVTFSGNSADHGGGMANDYSSPTLTNVTFSGNSAYHFLGGSMYNFGNIYEGESSPTLTNCILWGNTAPEIYNSSLSTVTVTYSIVQGGWTGTGNVDDDPQFVRPPSPGADSTWGTADDDYGDLRLRSGSPAIDAGDNTAVPPDVADLDGDGDTGEPTPLDLDMLPRFVGTALVVDLGAYECQTPNYPPVASDQSVTADEDTPEAITLSATDPDDDELTFSIVSAPSHGTLTGFNAETGTVVYTPYPDYHGDDSFTFKANDGTADSNVATVAVTVVSAEEQIQSIAEQVWLWVDEGVIDQGQGNALQSKLDNAIDSLAKNNVTAAVNKLRAFENQIQALVNSGRLTREEGDAIVALTEAAIHSALPGAEEATDAAIAELGKGHPLLSLPDDSVLHDLVSAGSSKPGKGGK
jgi:hypothetical protein